MFLAATVIIRLVGEDSVCLRKGDVPKTYFFNRLTRKIRYGMDNIALVLLLLHQCVAKSMIQCREC